MSDQNKSKAEAPRAWGVLLMIYKSTVKLPKFLSKKREILIYLGGQTNHIDKSILIIPHSRGLYFLIYLNF